MNDFIVHKPATSKTYTGKMICFTYLVFNIQNQLITILKTYNYHYGEKKIWELEQYFYLCKRFTENLACGRKPIEEQEMEKGIISVSAAKSRCTLTSHKKMCKLKGVFIMEAWLAEGLTQKLIKDAAFVDLDEDAKKIGLLVSKLLGIILTT